MRNNTILLFLLLIFVFVFVMILAPINSHSHETEIIPICFILLICSNENCVSSVTYQYESVNPSLIYNSASKIYNKQELTFAVKIKNVLKYTTCNSIGFLSFDKTEIGVINVDNINLNSIIIAEKS